MSENRSMPFWSHLEDLRWMLLRIIVAVFSFAIVAFVAMPSIYDNWILGPTRADFILYEFLCRITSALPFVPDFCDTNFHVDIININLSSQFFIHMSTSLWLALVLALPYSLFEIWKFVNPALYTSEKGKMAKAFGFSSIMFFIGCAIGYLFIFPITFRFLATYQLSPDIKNQISLDSYMDNFMTMILIMGLMFELPLIAWLLGKFGIVNRSLFNRYRRHAIVILLIASAFITPSGDPFTLAVVFIPLYLLFELSYFLVLPTKK